MPLLTHASLPAICVWCELCDKHTYTHMHTHTCIHTCIHRLCAMPTAHVWVCVLRGANRDRLGQRWFMSHIYRARARVCRTGTDRAQEWIVFAHGARDSGATLIVCEESNAFTTETCLWCRLYGDRRRPSAYVRQPANTVGDRSAPVTSFCSVQVPKKKKKANER
jgi:hypothetical protein